MASSKAIRPQDLNRKYENRVLELLRHGDPRTAARKAAADILRRPGLADVHSAISEICNAALETSNVEAQRVAARILKSFVAHTDLRGIDGRTVLVAIRAGYVDVAVQFVHRARWNLELREVVEFAESFLNEEAIWEAILGKWKDFSGSEREKITEELEQEISGIFPPSICLTLLRWNDDWCRSLVLRALDREDVVSFLRGHSNEVAGVALAHDSHLTEIGKRIFNPDDAGAVENFGRAAVEAEVDLDEIEREKVLQEVLQRNRELAEYVILQYGVEVDRCRSLGLNIAESGQLVAKSGNVKFWTTDDGAWSVLGEIARRAEPRLVQERMLAEASIRRPSIWADERGHLTVVGKDVGWNRSAVEAAESRLCERGRLTEAGVAAVEAGLSECVANVVRGEDFVTRGADPGNFELSQAATDLIEADARSGNVIANRLPASTISINGTFTSVGRFVLERVGWPRIQESVPVTEYSRSGNLTEIGTAILEGVGPSMLRHIPTSECFHGPTLSNVGRILFEEGFLTAELVADHSPALLLENSSDSLWSTELTVSGRQLIEPVVQSFLTNRLSILFPPSSDKPTPLGVAIAAAFPQEILDFLRRSRYQNWRLFLSASGADRTEFCAVLENSLNQHNESLSVFDSQSAIGNSISHCTDIPPVALAKLPGLLTVQRLDAFLSLQGIDHATLQFGIENAVQEDVSVAKRIVEKRGLVGLSAIERVVGHDVHPSQVLNRVGPWLLFALLSLASVGSDIWFCVSLFMASQATKDSLAQELFVASVVSLVLTFIANAALTYNFVKRSEKEFYDNSCVDFQKKALWGENPIITTIVLLSCIASPEAGTLLYGNVSPPLAIGWLKASSWPAALLEEFVHIGIQIIAFSAGGKGVDDSVPLIASTITTILQLAFRFSRAVVVSGIGLHGKATKSGNLEEGRALLETTTVQSSYGSYDTGRRNGAAEGDIGHVELSSHRPLVMSPDSSLIPAESLGKESWSEFEAWELGDITSLPRLSTLQIVLLAIAGFLPLLLVAIPLFTVVGIAVTLSVDSKCHSMQSLWTIVGLVVAGVFIRVLLVHLLHNIQRYRPFRTDVLYRPELHGLFALGSIFGDATLLSKLLERISSTKSSFRADKCQLRTIFVFQLVSLGLSTATFVQAFNTPIHNCISHLGDVYRTACIIGLVGSGIFSLAWVMNATFAKKIPLLSVPTAARKNAACCCILTYLAVFSWLTLLSISLLVKPPVFCYFGYQRNATVSLMANGSWVSWEDSVYSSPLDPTMREREIEKARKTPSYAPGIDDDTSPSFFQDSCDSISCTTYFVGEESIAIRPTEAMFEHCSSLQYSDFVTLPQTLQANCAPVMAATCKETLSPTYEFVEYICRPPAGLPTAFCTPSHLNHSAIDFSSNDFDDDSSSTSDSSSQIIRNEVDELIGSLLLPISFLPLLFGVAYFLGFCVPEHDHDFLSWADFVLLQSNLPFFAVFCLCPIILFCVPFSPSAAFMLIPPTAFAILLRAGARCGRFIPFLFAASLIICGTLAISFFTNVFKADSVYKIFTIVFWSLFIIWSCLISAGVDYQNYHYFS